MTTIFSVLRQVLHQVSSSFQTIYRHVVRPAAHVTGAVMASILIFSGLIGWRSVGVGRDSMSYSCMSFVDNSISKQYPVLFDVRSGATIPDRRYPLDYHYQYAYPIRFPVSNNQWIIYEIASNEQPRTTRLEIASASDNENSPQRWLLADGVSQLSLKWSSDFRFLSMIYMLPNGSLNATIIEITANLVNGLIEPSITSNSFSALAQYKSSGLVDAIYSYNNRFVIISMQQSVILWDIQSAKIIATEPLGVIESVSWSADSTRVAFLSHPILGSPELSVKILHVNTLKTSAIPLKYSNYSPELYWSPDGQFIALGGAIVPKNTDSPQVPTLIDIIATNPILSIMTDTLNSTPRVSNRRMMILGWNTVTGRLIYQTDTTPTGAVDILSYDPISKVSTPVLTNANRNDHGAEVPDTDQLWTYNTLDGNNYFSTFVIDLSQREPVILVGHAATSPTLMQPANRKSIAALWTTNDKPSLAVYTSGSGRVSLINTFQTIKPISPQPWVFPRRYDERFLFMIGSLRATPDRYSLFRIDVTTTTVVALTDSYPSMETSQLMLTWTYDLEGQDTPVLPIRLTWHDGSRVGLIFVDPVDSEARLNITLQRPVNLPLNDFNNRAIEPYYPLARKDAFIPLAQVRYDNLNGIPHQWIELFLENQQSKIIDLAADEELHYGNQSSEGDAVWSPDGQFFYYMIRKAQTQFTPLQFIPHIIDRYGSDRYFVPLPRQANRLVWSTCFN